MTIRCAADILTATILVATAAVGASAVQPKNAEAADIVSVKTCAGGTIDLTTDEKRTLDLHNKTRADNNLPLFCVAPTLTKAARTHSREMLSKDYFSHSSFNDETFSARLERFGCNYRAVGENIAWGSGSLGAPDDIFKAWMNSSGHKTNVLDENFRDIGIGTRARTKTYSGTTMYTVDLGTRR